MRATAVIPALCIGYVIVSQAATGMEAITSCTLGSDRAHTISLLRDHPIENTVVYYLSRDGAAPLRIYQGDEDQSRGQDMQVACVGSNERAFVLSGEFTSNYLQGVAIRYNTGMKRWERIDFAERTRPAAVYFGEKGMELLIPNTTRNESAKRYIIYRYQNGKDNGGQTYSDQPPKSHGAKIPSTKTNGR